MNRAERPSLRGFLRSWSAVNTRVAPANWRCLTPLQLPDYAHRSWQGKGDGQQRESIQPG